MEARKQKSVLKQRQPIISYHLNEVWVKNLKSSSKMFKILHFTTKLDIDFHYYKVESQSHTLLSSIDKIFPYISQGSWMQKT